MLKKKKINLKITAEELIARREQKLSEDFKSKITELELLKEEVFFKKNELKETDDYKLSLQVVISFKKRRNRYIKWRYKR